MQIRQDSSVIAQYPPQKRVQHPLVALAPAKAVLKSDQINIQALRLRKAKAQALLLRRCRVLLAVLEKIVIRIVIRMRAAIRLR
jgi:hypothetical protein